MKQQNTCLMHRNAAPGKVLKYSDGTFHLVMSDGSRRNVVPSKDGKGWEFLSRSERRAALRGAATARRIAAPAMPVEDKVLRHGDGREPRINVYVCSARHCTLTVDVDEGATPFIIDCKEEGCKEGAQSLMYPRGPIPPDMPPVRWEWYKPSASQMSRLDTATAAHVEQGGLLLRPRTPNLEPIYH